MRLLAETLCEHARFRAELTPRPSICCSNRPRCDIGKGRRARPDPAQAWQKLDADEFAQMKHHSILGKEAIVHAEALG